MSQQQSHELQSQQPLSAEQVHQHTQEQVPTAPQPTHDNAPNAAATENHPPSYDQARVAPTGQPPVMAQGQVPMTVTPLNQLTDNPTYIDCPFCHKRAKTIVNKEGGGMQFAVGAVLCLVCICLSCLPCMLHWFEDTEYICSCCNKRVAMRKSDGPLEVYGPPQVVYSQYGNQPANNTQQPPQAGTQPMTQVPEQPASQHAAQQQGTQQQSQQEIQSQPAHAQQQYPADVKTG